MGVEEAPSGRRAVPAVCGGVSNAPPPKFGIFPIFTAVAEKVGFDRRGNTLYQRSPEGREHERRVRRAGWPATIERQRGPG